LLNGRDFRHMIWSGYAWLERHRDTVNALNVFPVPDGDTGTNMVLTMRAAWSEIDDADDTDIGLMAQAVAQGALMGARGNSGVILSQILRGLAHTFRQKATITAQDLVLGLGRASETAYKGVVKPVEGTILTVMREAATAAQRAVSVDSDLNFVLARTVQGGSRGGRADALPAAGAGQGRRG
jgi:dihydroxyacetone kinase-like predicted kinase